MICNLQPRQTLNTISSLSLCRTMVSLSVLGRPTCSWATSSVIRLQKIVNIEYCHNIADAWNSPWHGVVPLHQSCFVNVNLGRCWHSEHVLNILRYKLMLLRHHDPRQKVITPSVTWMNAGLAARPTKSSMCIPLSSKYTPSSRTFSIVHLDTSRVIKSHQTSRDQMLDLPHLVGDALLLGVEGVQGQQPGVEVDQGAGHVHGAAGTRGYNEMHTLQTVKNKYTHLTQDMW